METLAFTADIIGKVMIAYTVLAVHHRLGKEQKIDEAVFGALRREKMIGIAGIGFMLLGYLLHIL